MPLPSSGPISINNIRNELDVSDGSLGGLGALAGISDFGQQIAISNFYGYNAYTLIVSYVSAGSPCNAATYNIFQNAGNGYYYAQDAYSPGAYTIVTGISSAWFLYSYYDERFDAYIYNEYETNGLVFNYIGDAFSFCAPS